jgi:hypothetical protein
MLRPGDNLRAVEQHGVGSDTDHQIAQETDARLGHRGEVCKKTL